MQTEGAEAADPPAGQWVRLYEGLLWFALADVRVHLSAARQRVQALKQGKTPEQWRHDTFSAMGGGLVSADFQSLTDARKNEHHLTCLAWKNLCDRAKAGELEIEGMLDPVTGEYKRFVATAFRYLKILPDSRGYRLRESLGSARKESQLWYEIRVRRPPPEIKTEASAPPIQSSLVNVASALAPGLPQMQGKPEKVSHGEMVDWLEKVRVPTWPKNTKYPNGTEDLAAAKQHFRDRPVAKGIFEQARQNAKLPEGWRTQGPRKRRSPNRN